VIHRNGHLERYLERVNQPILKSLYKPFRLEVMTRALIEKIQTEPAARSCRRADQLLSAVHAQHLTADPICQIGGEKQHAVRNFFGRAEAL
jgi:hypothetical protein